MTIRIEARNFLLVAAFLALAAPARAQSPDGSELVHDMTTAAGTWSFGPQWDQTNWYIYLNGGSAAGGIGSQLVVANGGQVYVLGTDGSWYVWQNVWVWVGQPTLPAPLAMPTEVPAPDGSTLLPSLATSVGVWSFGPQWASGEWYLYLNGQSAGGGIGSEILVANGGQVYVLGTDDNWYVWQNGWSYYSNVMPAPTALRPTPTLTFDPPNPSIAHDAPLGSAVATIISSWSDGSQFIGTLSFAPPYADDQGVFAISGRCQRRLNSDPLWWVSPIES